jgi:hypothetical protein
MSILANIKKIKHEKEAWSRQRNAEARAEETARENHRKELFAIFEKGIMELDGEWVAGHICRVTGNDKKIMLRVDGTIVCSFGVSERYVPCNCENPCDCEKEYEYKVTVNPECRWKDMDDKVTSFTIDYLSEQEIRNEERLANGLLRIIEDAECNVITHI